mmetsp:Transcript_17907/g.31140  ORF Transcript_17907/g.31140 Transcript_17907/m.31140 type:complete len:256 (-) Transcript_17907:129-896(-)
MPKGLGNAAPPPFNRFSAITTTTMKVTMCTLSQGVARSDSSRASSSGLVSAGMAMAMDGFSPASRIRPASAAAGLLSSFSFTRSINDSRSPWSSSSSIALVRALFFKPSKYIVSLLNCEMPFSKVPCVVYARSKTKEITNIQSGMTLLTNAPTIAPAIVNGSITKIRSQSTKGRSHSGCLFGMLSTMFVIDDPTIVKLLRGTANFGEKLKIKIRSGTKMPPPPIPPAAATSKPKVTVRVPQKSLESIGNRSLCCW